MEHGLLHPTDAGRSTLDSSHEQSWSKFLASSKPLLTLQTEDTASESIKLIHSLSKLNKKCNLLTVELLIKLYNNTTSIELQGNQLLIIYSIDEVSQESCTALEIVLSNLLQTPHIKIVYLYSEESDLPTLLRESELNYCTDPSLFEVKDFAEESSHVSYLNIHQKFVNKIISCEGFSASHDKELVLHQLRIFSLQTLEKEYTEKILEIETRVTGEWRETLNHLIEYDLVRSDGDNNFNFFHRSVAYYFLADLIVRWLRREELRYTFLPLGELYLNKVLLLPEYQVVRIFINAFLLKDPLSDKALKYFVEKTCAELNGIRGERKQTALHVAVEENMSCIVMSFTSCPGYLVPFIAAHDSDGRTALHLALDIAGSSCRPLESINKALLLDSWTPEQKHTILVATFLQCCYQPIRQFSITDVTQFYCCAMEYCLLQTISDDCKLIVKKIQSTMGSLASSFVKIVSNSSEEEIEHKWKWYNSVQCHYLPLVINSCGQTAVNIAASKGYARIIKLFINKDVCMSRDESGMTPLHCAAGEGHSEVIKLLIGEGAPLNSQDRLGCTPLALAAKAGHIVAVKLLVEAGADVNITDHKGKIPFSIAEAQGHFQIVSFLIQNGSHSSAKTAAAIRYIMEIEKDEKYKGWDLILVAASQGNLIVLEYLVGLSADLHCTNPEGNTPLLCAALNGHANIVNFLIIIGVNPNYEHVKTGETALMYAAQKGRVDVVESLLDKVDINATSNTNTTALIFSARERHYAVMYVLLKNNADRDIKDNDGKSALMYAEDVNIIQHFIENGFDPNYEDEKTKNTALMVASMEGNLDVVMYMVDKVIDPNYPNVRSGYTPLILAALVGYPHIVEYLLEKGVDINTRSHSGDTAIMSAAMMGHYEVVNVLLEYNADCFIENNEGMTVLELSLLSRRQDVIEVINYYVGVQRMMINFMNNVIL